MAIVGNENSQLSSVSMPPINKAGNGAADGPERIHSSKVTGFPDRDNPLAWKRATEAGTRGAKELLRSLTDEEVVRYMSVARDQIAIEDRRKGLKVASAIGGLAVMTWFGLQGIWVGYRGWVLAGMALGFAMVYWPWRVLKCKQLWQKHFDAAREEQVRRNVSV